jgi:Zn-dependent protease with chaperone function
VLLIGFYVLALAMIAALAGVLYLETKLNTVYVYAVLLPLIGIIGIVWAIVPRSDPFRVLGVRLERKTQPRLFALLDGVAAITNQRTPNELYLVPEVNAWVSQHGGLFGIGSRRVIGIGLPLLGVFNVSQLRSVLVHEYGHYSGGDTVIGPLVYATRSVIGRTMQALAGDNSFLHWPFELYGELFLRLTLAVSRQQEWAADYLACRVAGPRVFAQSLWLIRANSLIEEEFWKTQIEPVVDAGFLPPIGEGFQRFATAASIAPKLSERTALTIEKEEESLYDSHPVMRDRIARARALPDNGGKECRVPALSLVDDLPVNEARLLARIIGRERVNALEYVSWSDAGRNVYLAEWDELRKRHSQVIKGLTADVLLTLHSSVLSVADRLGVSLTLRDQAREQVAVVLGRCLAAALTRGGWDVQALPGPQIRCQQGDYVVEPIEIFRQLIVGSLPPESARAWANWAAQWLTTPTN